MDRPSQITNLAPALTTGRFLDIERIHRGSNAVFAVQVESPSGPVRAIYKPARGERPLWDFPAGTLHRREVATFVLDQALGWGFVPTTVLRRDAPLGRGSLQEWVEAPPDGAAVERRHLEVELRRLAVLDLLANNADRKGVHLLLDRQLKLRAIDHGVTFNVDFKLRTVLADLGGEEVPQPVLADLSSLFGDGPRLDRLRSELGRLLRREEVAAFEARALGLISQPRYPRLHPWYGRPFEW